MAVRLNSDQRDWAELGGLPSFLKIRDRPFLTLSSFLLVRMQRSWQEAKPPPWIMRTAHTEDGSQQRASLGSLIMLKAFLPVLVCLPWFIWEQTSILHKPEINFAFSSKHSWSLISPFSEMRVKVYPVVASLSVLQMHFWLLESRFQPLL